MSDWTGRFVWHDLMATDLEASMSFFTQLFGWTTRAVDMGEMGEYTMIFAGEQSIGGIVPLDAASGIPPHWIGYVDVDDVDAACARAEQGGGQVCVPGTDIPGVGRFAVLTDPAGSAISPYKSASERCEKSEDDTGPSPIGTFCWNELATTDPEACRAFYGEVFGWTCRTEPGGGYEAFIAGETDVAGMEKAEGHPHWLGYVKVEDVAAAVEKVKELGGTVTKEPGDVPCGGKFAVVADPTGAAFGLYNA
jgi:predicted enzyme related to lactoylglutathione lyase